MKDFSEMYEMQLAVVKLENIFDIIQANELEPGLGINGVQLLEIYDSFPRWKHKGTSLHPNLSYTTIILKF